MGAAEYAGGRRPSGITAAFSGARDTTRNADGPWLDLVLQPQRPWLDLVVSVVDYTRHHGALLRRTSSANARQSRAPASDPEGAHQTSRGAGHAEGMESLGAGVSTRIQL